MNFMVLVLRIIWCLWSLDIYSYSLQSHTYIAEERIIYLPNLHCSAKFLEPGVEGVLSQSVSRKTSQPYEDRLSADAVTPFIGRHISTFIQPQLLFHHTDSRSPASASESFKNGPQSPGNLQPRDAAGDQTRPIRALGFTWSARGPSLWET